MFIQKVLFTKKECLEILSKKGEFKNSKIKLENEIPKSNIKYRNSKTSNINSNKVKDIILDKLSLIDNTIKSLPDNIDITRYDEGDFFIKHQDSSSDYPNRLKTLVIQLSNENYTGGILKVWENNNVPHISSTEIGNVIIFNFDYYHEVTKLVKGTRYVLVCWLTNDNFK